MDINGFLQTLEDSGYDDFVTIELYPYEETLTKLPAVRWTTSKSMVGPDTLTHPFEQI